MKTNELIRKLRALDQSMDLSGDVYKKFYLKDAQAVLLPIADSRVANSTEKEKAEVPADRHVMVIVAEGDS